MVYEYDFGDAWGHDILLERVTEPDSEDPYPMVMAGNGACPPEDVGGLAGYYKFLEAMLDPNHPEHANMGECWGPTFEPDRFDLQAINKVLLRRYKRVRRGA